MIEQREQIERYTPLNDERAEQFVNEWEEFVLSCIRRVRIADEEDVLYRVFLRALDALPKFRSDSKISTWLYRITWREGLRHIQKKCTLFETVSAGLVPNLPHRIKVPQKEIPFDNSSLIPPGLNPEYRS